MPADVVKQEEDLARQQIIDSGKPADLVDKILTGKMGRWFSERVLLEQPFVKDDKQKVGKVAESAGVKVKGYTRMTVTG
jgi:elongation factor Ts